MRRRKEHGGAMMVTLIIILVLLAGAAMLVSIEVNSTRSTGMTRTGVTAMYCAEAGLTGARQVVANNYGQWPNNFCTNPNHDLCTEPTWIQSGFVHDLDGDGDVDVKVLLVDNDDEVASGLANDPAVDVDRRVFIVAKCLTFPEAQRELSELVEVEGGVACNEAQKGKGTGAGVKCN